MMYGNVGLIIFYSILGILIGGALYICKTSLVSRIIISILFLPMGYLSNWTSFFTSLWILTTILIPYPKERNKR